MIIYAGDVGRAIQITISPTITNGTTITSVVVKIRKPSGTTTAYTFSLGAATSTSLVLTRVSDGAECDEVGKAYARVWSYVNGVLVQSTPEFLIFDVKPARVTQPA
jgi:hypothetical protein